MVFIADFPGAIVVEAATYGYNGKPGLLNIPRGIGIHTPEEAPDDYPATPYYFHNLTNRQASTTFFVSYLGFVFQCVPVKSGAYGNALEGKPSPIWATSDNLNLQSISIEVEGFASSIHITMPRGSAQWVSLVRLVAWCCKTYNIPTSNIFGHYEVSIFRSDPGQMNLSALAEDVNFLLKGETTFMSALTDAQQLDLYNRVLALTSKKNAGTLPGFFAKSPTNPDIYLIQINGNRLEKRNVSDAETFIAAGGNWDDVKEVPQESLDNMRTNTAIKSVK